MRSSIYVTYRVIRVYPLLLDRPSVGETHYHSCFFLRVTTDTDVDSSCALSDERHEVKEWWMNVRAACSVSLYILVHGLTTYPFRPTIV